MHLTVQSGTAVVAVVLYIKSMDCDTRRERRIQWLPYKTKMAVKRKCQGKKGCILCEWMIFNAFSYCVRGRIALY